MSALVELVCVPPADVRRVWPHVQPLLYLAAKRGGGHFAAIEKDVLDGPDLLWLAWDGNTILAAAVTSLGIISNTKTCTIVVCGGHGWERFGHMIEGLEKFAKTEGCERVRINGRPGWQRALNGYGLKSVVLEKEI